MSRHAPAVEGMIYHVPSPLKQAIMIAIHQFYTLKIKKRILKRNVMNHAPSTHAQRLTHPGPHKGRANQLAKANHNSNFVFG